MRGIMLFLLCVSVLYGIDIKPKRESIIEAKPKSVSFAANGLKVGQSGIILTHKNGYNVIIASTTITRIKDNIAYAEYEPFESIAQKYLPTPTFEPTQGDEVLIGGFRLTPSSMSFADSEAVSWVFIITSRLALRLMISRLGLFFRHT